MQTINPNLKTVLLLGDSIRRGYDEFVAEKLKGEANVVFHEDNGRYGPYTLRELDRWKIELGLENADIVHWNFGLWDLLHLDAHGAKELDNEALSTYSPVEGNTRTYETEPLVPPEFYSYYIKRVHARIAELFPGCIQIFATTTPVMENRATWAYRSNAELEDYNRRARDILKSVAIDDLWQTIRSGDAAELYGKEWVHFTDKGYDRLAESVAASVRQFL